MSTARTHFPTMTAGKITPRQHFALLAESHRLQFHGVDWQEAANDTMSDVEGDEEAREELYKELSASPDPDCECGFCATAPWRDE